MKEQIKQRVEDLIKEKIIRSVPVGGGSIAENYLLSSEKCTNYFLKTGTSLKKMFTCEANGLKEIAKTKTIRTPQVLFACEEFLLLEAISSLRPAGDSFFEDLGKRLAKMHGCYSHQFGFFEDNFIGTNIQLNQTEKTAAENWSLFYFENRLLYQYKLAEKNGYVSERLKRGVLYLENHLDDILKSSIEKPCLLHGDLWAGNYLCDDNYSPVLIDPAVYYGHREADLAMTKVFGGFPPSFYSSYQEENPLQPGWETRMPVYKLYHILNHLNMFGTGYLREAEDLVAYYM